MAVGVVGAGVVGAAVAHALAARGVEVVVFEAEPEPALAASGTNSGILHNGFDSIPAELETKLILRSAELRDPLLARLGIEVVRCGALLRPADAAEIGRVAAIAERARRNGVEVELGADGVLSVPGESVTDPVAYVKALLAAANGGSSELRLGTTVERLERRSGALVVHTADGESLACGAVVNCAGLRADEVAGLAGDESFSIYPRKGEFFVFEPPDGPLERILLPVPSERTKGVLVFPTVDGKLVAGPTAHDQDDKQDWSVRPGAFDEVLAKATRMLPALAGAEPIASYAGLRPAGRGCNYVIGPATACPPLLNVAAIRSTGLSASLGIAERVVSILAAGGLELGEPRELPKLEISEPTEPWWLRASRRAAVTR